MQLSTLLLIFDAMAQMSARQRLPTVDRERRVHGVGHIAVTEAIRLAPRG